ncbi:MAG: serine/threonine-protein kinase PknK, partial [Pseudanabaenales cyanobacterium]|nr:serine/threonine-protein kinase PknK [Pseudanabaenales cyanobacterium]
TLEQFFPLAIQIARILGEIHAAQIIHKDINPGNIVFNPVTGIVKIIDFSIATQLNRETPVLKSPSVLEGTLAYLSPEQTGRMNRSLDYRSDFYSLGATFYELLTGQPPFITQDALELVHCHLAIQPTPPDQINASIPPALSHIVIKLLAKNAEDRYQSVLGLIHDLERCCQQWEATREITLFELGEQERCDRFIIPEKLYGRETEVQTLLTAFERVSGNTCNQPKSKIQNPKSELVLVSGFSGIGKTAVVREVHKPITRQKGYFIQGKFDQFNRNLPFSAFVQAFRSLMGQLLGESDQALARWKVKILEAVGNNGQVLIDVIPKLERIIGPQSPVPDLAGSAAQNRFNLLFSQFIRVFTTQDHPLVIFLDDLQWVDSASLNLLKLLMNEVETGYLLVLGAYRDNEVFPAHPLMLSLAELEKQQAVISTITLAPLAVDQINQLVADTLSCDEVIVQPLTELVYQKTKGNPFFTIQFLKGLYEDELISFNFDREYWECDLVRVQDASLTDDVVEFMAGRLQKLPIPTQKVLELAACIGNQFDLETLAVVCNKSEAEVAADIWGA